MTTMRWQYGLGLLVLAGLGCSKEPYALAPVSGQVTLNGQALPNATVTFQPIGSKNQDPGPGSTGRTDAEGRYTLQVVAVGSKRQGAVVGLHRVSITTQSGANPQAIREDKPPPPEILPPRYNSKTELTHEVPPEGTDQADFPLLKP
jgi:hypothetical protein